MGIRVKNQHQYMINLSIPGTAVTAATNKACAIIPFPAKISNVYATCSSGGSGSTNSIVDVNLNGTTIFSAATKITFAATTGVATYSALSNNPTNVTAGSIISLDTDAVSTSLSNVNVVVTLTRTNIGAATNIADHDTIM